MTDNDIQRRLDTAEHLIAVLLASQSESPRKLVAMYPPTFHLDDDVIQKAEAIWQDRNVENIV